MSVKQNIFFLGQTKRTLLDRPLYFKNTSLERVQNIMFLGLNLNENLSRKFHMIAFLKKLRSYCGVIFKLRHYLYTENLIQVYHFLIESRLRYGIIVWNHGNKTIVNKMQHNCNKFISFINSNEQTGKHNFLSIN